MYKLLNRISICVAVIAMAGGCAKSSRSSGDGSVEQYIVVFKETSVRSEATLFAKSMTTQEVVHSMSNRLSDRFRLKNAKRVFSVALMAAVLEMSEKQKEEILKDQSVAYIEKDGHIQVEALQSNATWGLDRLDQTALPLNGTYQNESVGSVVNAYIIDTGILTTHSEFEGRADSGTDIVDGDQDATDCNGHGTHVAGTIGSKTYGVAKNVRLHAVRVLDCAGSGQFSDVIAGIEWVTAHHVKPAVANMSLGGPIAQTIDDAVAASIRAGVTYVVAAGNENVSACNGSPSRVPTAITVGASTSTDARSSFSNFGNCVDIFAPGSDIKSTWMTSNSATNTISGTSMASPHVAGVAALYLAQHPQGTPQEVEAALVANSVNNKITGVGAGSPNKLLNVSFLLGSNGGGGGGGGGSQPDLELKNGVARSNLSGTKGSDSAFYIDLPTGVESLTISTSGGSGDADLYVKMGSNPTATSYDCRPFTSGNNEQCALSNPAGGRVYILVRGYVAFSGLSIRADFQMKVGDPTSPCAACQVYTGNLGGKGAFDYQPNGTFYESISGRHEYHLRGPQNADFDLYLYRYDGSSWVEMAKAIKSNSIEDLVYQGSAGSYLLKVISYSGSGDYKLFRAVP